MSDEFLDQRRQALEDQFFHKQDDEKLKALRAKLSEDSERDGLRRASGMTDDALLDKLESIGLSGDTVAALSLVPLVHVAWADGKMQDEERKAILQAAHGKQIEENSAAHSVIESWLSSAPDPALFSAWRDYIKGLGRELLNEQQFAVLRTQIVGFARGVAEAAGGFLGIGRIASAEEDALATIDDAFNL